MEEWDVVCWFVCLFVCLFVYFVYFQTVASSMVEVVTDAGKGKKKPAIKRAATAAIVRVRVVVVLVLCFAFRPLSCLSLLMVLRRPLPSV
jgi:Na+/H+ antiporter NhaD/arsenite permease-like protein